MIWNLIDEDDDSNLTVLLSYSFVGGGMRLNKPTITRVPSNHQSTGRERERVRRVLHRKRFRLFLPPSWPTLDFYTQFTSACLRQCSHPCYDKIIDSPTSLSLASFGGLYTCSIPRGLSRCLKGQHRYKPDSGKGV